MGIAKRSQTYKLITLSWKTLCKTTIQIWYHSDFLSDEDLDLHKANWIFKFHKTPYKQRYIAGSAKF